MGNIVRNFVAFLFVVLLIACGATNQKTSKLEDTQALDDLANAKELKLDVNWVRPLMTTSVSSALSSGLILPGNPISQINVMGNGYFIQIEGDSVSGNLPYYGERQMGGGFNANAGIKFKGVTENLEITKNEAKQFYNIGFTITEEVETFSVRMRLFPDLSATTVINSSYRTSIRYEGDVAAIDKEELQ